MPDQISNSTAHGLLLRFLGGEPNEGAGNDGLALEAGDETCGLILRSSFLRAARQLTEGLGVLGRELKRERIPQPQALGGFRSEAWATLDRFRVLSRDAFRLGHLILGLQEEAMLVQGIVARLQQTLDETLRPFPGLGEYQTSEAGFGSSKPRGPHSRQAQAEERKRVREALKASKAAVVTARKELRESLRRQERSLASCRRCWEASLPGGQHQVDGEQGFAARLRRKKPK